MKRIVLRSLGFFFLSVFLAVSSAGVTSAQSSWGDPCPSGCTWENQGGTVPCTSNGPPCPTNGSSCGTIEAIVCGSCGHVGGGQYRQSSYYCGGGGASVGVDVPPPAPTLSYECNSLGNSVLFRWTGTTINTNPVTFFQLDGTLGSNIRVNPPLGTISARTYIQTYQAAITPGASYSERVRAAGPGNCGAFGCGTIYSPYSNRVTFSCSPPPPPPPDLTLSVRETANPGNTASNGGTITIPNNTTATLSWAVSNATSCTASGNWSGSKNSANGTWNETTAALPGNATPYTYTLRCVNSAGNFIARAVYVSVPASFSCTGSVPGFSQLCPGDDTGLIMDTSRVLVASCSVPAGSNPKCQYTCTPPATYNASTNSCIICSVCDSASNHCLGERWADNCGTANACGPGTKDCRQWYEEVQP